MKTSLRTYQVRGYWHSNGATFQETFSEAPSKDSMYVMDKAELLCFLDSNKYGWTYYDQGPNRSYKNSFTILQVAKNYDD